MYWKIKVSVGAIINKKFFEQQNIEQVSADSEEFRMMK